MSNQMGSKNVQLRLCVCSMLHDCSLHFNAFYSDLIRKPVTIHH